MKIKGAVLYSTKEALKIESNIEIPLLKPGQILVKIAYSGVCHSQLMEVRGKRGEDRFLPHLLGHEGTGTVVEVGKGVEKVNPGDQVILGWIKGKGIDVPGSQYKIGDLKINSGAVTTFSNFSVVSENRCVKLPSGVPMDAGVLFGCAIPTGAGIPLNQIKPEKDSSVAVIGLGGIGLSALIALKIFDCSQIIAVDVEEKKLDLAREFGATHFINASQEDVLKAIYEITDKKGVDYCIEAGGLTSTIELAFQTIRKFGGLCVFASHPPFGEKIRLDPFELISGKRIEGSWGGNCMPDNDIPKFADLYKQGKLPLEKLINKRYKLEDVNQALDDLENRKVTRALLEISP